MSRASTLVERTALSRVVRVSRVWYEESLGAAPAAKLAHYTRHDGRLDA